MIRPRARLLSHSSSFKRQCLPCRPRFVLWLPASHLILTITSVASWTSRYYRLLNFCVAFAKLRLPQRHLLSPGSIKLLEGHDRVALGGESVGVRAMLQAGGLLGKGEVVHLGGLAQVAVVVTGDVGGLRYAVLPAALGAYRPKPPGAEQLLLLVLPTVEPARIFPQS